MLGRPRLCALLPLPPGAAAFSRGQVARGHAPRAAVRALASAPPPPAPAPAPAPALDEEQVPRRRAPQADWDADAAQAGRRVGREAAADATRPAAEATRPGADAAQAGRRVGREAAAEATRPAAEATRPEVGAWKLDAVRLLRPRGSPAQLRQLTAFLDGGGAAVEEPPPHAAPPASPSSPPAAAAPPAGPTAAAPRAAATAATATARSTSSANSTGADAEARRVAAAAAGGYWDSEEEQAVKRPDARTNPRQRAAYFGATSAAAAATPKATAGAADTFGPYWSAVGGANAGSQRNDTPEAQDDAWLQEMFTPPTPLSAAAVEKKARMALHTTEFDRNGDVKESNGKYYKADLCAIHNLQPRDLRVIDNFRNQMPALLVRSSAIVVNLEHIKALIKADSVILFDTEHPDRHHLSLFVFDLQERLRTNASTAGSLPYELRALEAILVSVCNVLRDQYNQLSPKVAAVLRRLEGDIDRSTLLTLLDMTRKLTRFEARVNSTLDAVMEILNSDDDMAGMYLTTKMTTGHSQPTMLHEEVEFMFEYYSKQLEEIQAQVAELLSNIRTTQTVVKITLDAQRNSLLLLELRLTMGTFAVGCGGIAASLFGMNLPSGLEHSPYAFYAMASTVFLMSSSVFFFFLRRMRSLVRNKRYTP